MTEQDKQLADTNQIDIYIHSFEGAPRIWRMSGRERIQKQFEKYFDIQSCEYAFIDSLDESKANTVLILRDDVVYDWAVLNGLSLHDNIALIDENKNVLAQHISSADANNYKSEKLFKSDELPEKLRLIEPKDAGSGYRDALRKKEDPYALLVNKENANSIEWRLYMGSYKGVTDIVTKYLWPVPAFHVTRLCTVLGLSPNMVTSIGAVLTIAALYLFGAGFYWWGLLAGWIMTFLDTVDGKLARVTLTSSKWGNIFDHGIDLIHPPFWYITWGYGLYHYGVPLADGWLEPLLIAMFAFYVLGRLCEGYFIARFKIHLHVWRKSDSIFRLISSRRNPNMIVLTLCMLVARPDIGLIIITAWGGITFLAHIGQIVQAEWVSRKDPIHSWLKAGA